MAKLTQEDILAYLDEAKDIKKQLTDAGATVEYK